MPTVTLLKRFTHNGKTYEAGDTFEGTVAEIDTLTSQGYVKAEGEPAEPKEEPKTKPAHGEAHGEPPKKK
jgi:hypothetical protein